MYAIKTTLMSGCLRILCLIVILQPLMRGQQYKFDKYDQTQGLNNLQVQELTFDRQGFLWVATANGVFRFLGSHFEHYGPEQGLLERGIYQMYVDPDGRVWAATRGNLYLWKDNRFSPVGNPSVSLESGQFLLGLGKDRLLVNENGRLRQLQLNSSGGFLSSSLFFTPAQRKAQPELDRITAMAVAKNGTLWLGCGARICEYTGDKLQIWGPKEGVNPQPHNWRRFYVDRKGSVWAASEIQLLELKPGASHFEDVSPPKLDPHRYFIWFAVTEDREGRLLVNSAEGVVRREGESWKLIGTANGLEMINTTSLAIDRNGDPWLGTLGGVTHWTGYEHWESWTERQGLPSSIVWAVNTPATERILVGTIKGPVRVETNTQKVTPLWSGGPWSLGQVSGIAEGPEGYLWGATFSGSVFRIDPKSLATKIVAELAVHLYRFQIAPDGRAWIVSDKGVDVVDNPASSLKLRHCDEPDELLQVAPKNKIASMAIGKNEHHDIWILAEHSLLRYRDGVWSKPAFAGLDASRVLMREISAPQDGSVWVGGEDEKRRCAIWHLTQQGAGMKAVRLAVPASFADLVPHSILADSRGWIWLGTDNGFAGWNGSQWRIFTQESGLAWNDTDRNALSEAPDGSVWIGTPNGAAHMLHPESAFGPVGLSTAITSVQRGGESFPTHKIGSLPWAKSNLRFGFASPDTWNRSSLTFSYRVLGFDSSWTATEDSEAGFSSLPHGSYRFQVFATNPSLGSTSPVMESAFRILPPWWRTLWFYCVCVLGGIAMVWLTVRFRTHQLRAKKEELEGRVREMTIETTRLAERAQDAALAEERNRLAHEMHDTLAGAFTGIYMQLQAASDLAVSNESQSRACVSRAEELSRDGLRRVREFVQSLTINADDPAPSLEVMRTVVMAATEGTATTGRFIVVGSEKSLKRSCAITLTRIIQEAVGNAQRYAEAKNIVVRVSFEEYFVALSISDDGKGFVVDEQSEIGFGIPGMRARAKRLSGCYQLQSAPGRGTTILVELPDPFEAPLQTQ